MRFQILKSLVQNLFSFSPTFTMPNIIPNVGKIKRGIPIQQKSQTAENENSVPFSIIFMLQSDWLKFQIELNSL